MTPAEPSSTAVPGTQSPLEPPREWLQTQQGDWILPSLNARHFVASGAASTPGTEPSRIRAHDVLSASFGERLHRDDRLYIVIGSDSGQLLRYVHEHSDQPRGTRWIFIEPDDILATLRENPAIEAMCDDYVKLVGTQEWQETAALLQLGAYFRVDGVVLERSLAALDGTDPQYIELTAFFDAELTAQRFRTTAQLNVAPFIEPHILAAPNFLAGIDAFEDIFSGRQAVIIAGGPSLDEQIDWIRSHRDRLFLIAVSRVSGRLQEVGINPDLLVTVDPFPISLTVSRQMFDFPESTILVSGHHPYPAIANRWPNALFCAGPLVPWNDETINPGKALVMSGPTVTHMAAQLAIFMGFAEVVFCGLDLCHAPDGRTHAAGSSEAAAGPLMEFSAIPVTTNSGEATWTTPDYHAGIEALEGIAARAPETRFVNPSRHAARIEHVAHEPLDQLSPSGERFDRRPLERLREHVTATRRREHLKALDASIADVREELEKVANLAQLGLESNQAYFNLTHPERQKRHKRRMQAIDRLFRGRYQRAAALAQQAAKRAIMRTDLPHDFFALDREQAERLASQYYDAIRRQARRLLEPLELARERVGTRLLELDPTVTAEEIIDRYLLHDEPERAVWLKRNRPETPSALLDPAETIYRKRIEELLEQDQKRHRKKRSPRASLRQIERYFSNRNRQALAAMAGSLEKHREREAAKPYATYARGLEKELEQQLPDAAAMHAQVIEQADLEADITLIEHALLRLTHINIEAGQPAEAVGTLQAAANINPGHWRLAARLALLQNDAETGITALSRHLEHFPGDIERIRQLVRLFVALKLPDGLDFCEQYLPYCAPHDREGLAAFLQEARETLASGGR